jgi:hypothetical protein
MSTGVGGNLDGGRELTELEQASPSMGRLFNRIIKAVNTLATNTASSSTGEVAAPPPLAGVNVSVSPLGGGELMHVTLNHPGQVQRNSRYITEIHTDPSFGTPVIIHDSGSSRTLAPFHLPTFAPPVGGAPAVKNQYFVRAYSQNPSGQPSNIVVAGGASSPTPFTMNGTSQLAFSPPQGSGTGSNSGQGGQGLGRVQQRN